MTKELSLVERLRKMADEVSSPTSELRAMFDEAADALAEQTAVREELCEAVRQLIAAIPIFEGEQVVYDILKQEWELRHFSNTNAAVVLGRAALAKAAPETGEAE